MTLFLQDPFDPDPAYLIESLLDACQNARSGGALFAFASAAGAKLLLEDEAFVKFAAKNAFDLIVGVDAVTNTAALDAITKATKTAKGMTVSVFLNESQDALFHPKFCWFRQNGGGQLIVGSGNLTVGGLRANWEAFSVNTLNKGETAEVLALWNSWKSAHSSLLLPPDDPRVVARASKNTGWVHLVKSEKTGGKKGGETKEGGSDEEGTAPIQDDGSVLIAEIPKGGNRWTSAGFDLKNYEGFFGAKLGTQRRIVLQHVNADGTLGELESRPSVAVKSQNYRFELGAASGRSYPKKGAPVGVFVKVAPRTFRYRLLMPSDPDYRLVSEFLEQRWTGPANHMRRVPVSIAELRAAWPDSPLWVSD